MYARFCTILSVALLLCSCGLAQTTNATLRGTVTDISGGAVAGATVTLMEPRTGQTVGHATSTGGGDFEFNEIKPGTYELRCNATSFKEFVAQDIILDSGQVRRLDPQLTPGSTVEQVTVSAGASVINTESATLSDLFTAK